MKVVSKYAYAVTRLGHAGHANQDGNAVARDQIYIVRDTAACPNRMAGKSS